MRAGELRHRITIQQMQDTQNEYGEPTKEWVDAATVWASIEGLRGREYF
ncbi:MAG: phage head closure protein, partial [Archaeoglobus sp.]|nr:phage head closure protein [Archaeoglobus sp.]